MKTVRAAGSPYFVTTDFNPLYKNVGKDMSAGGTVHVYDHPAMD